jgi:TonB-dependent receptor
MLTKSRLLLSAACLAALAASPALAQTAAAPADAAQPATAGSTAAAAPEAAEPETIIVTGIRAALRSAEGIKRNSAQIIDSVVAQDIGKLPDISVADTAARIAGVQVYRQGGEASNVLVRGLPFFQTTYDGREIFTAETRYVALQDFPSQNVAALQVIKTSTADLVEPGLAGSVNVVSRRPFDFQGFTVSASAQANYTRNANAWRPQGNFLISDRWNTGIGEMGLLVNASYTEIRYLDNELSNTDFIADPTTQAGQRIRLPDIVRLFDRSGDRVRPSVNAAFQWKPTPELQVYAGFLWQGFRNRIDDRLLEARLFGATAYNNLTFRPGTNLVTGGSITTGVPPFTFQGGTYNTTDTFQYSGGLKWDRGPWHFTTDIARTVTTFRGSTESLDRVFNGTPSITFNNNTPQFNITGLTAPNAANGFTFQGLFEENQRSAGRGWQGRADGQYDIDGIFLKNVQLGVRYTDRGVSRAYANRYAFLLPLGRNASTLPVQGNVFNPGFASTDVQGIRSWFAPLYQSIRDNVVGLRQFVIDNCPAIVATGDTGNGCRGYTTAPVTAPVLYTATERTIAGYAQVNYAVGSLIDGAVGVRIVNTNRRILAPTALAAFQDVPSDQLDVLPNASARIKFTPKFQGRLAFSQTRTLPNFSDLNPVFIPAGTPAAGRGNGTPSDPQRGNAGNPNLAAYTSDNYDVSLEWYPKPATFMSIAYFHRDLNGFFQNTEVVTNDPIYGFTRVTVPFNSGKGRIDGVEIQGQSFLDVPSLPEWLRGFGVQASLTFLDAKVQSPDLTSGSPGPLRFQTISDQLNGASKFLYSIVGLYEYRKLSARLTLNGRSSFVATRQGRGDDFYEEWAKPPLRLDFSLITTFWKTRPCSST